MTDERQTGPTPEERAQTLYERLDTFAMDHDCHEFGLPMSDKKRLEGEAMVAAAIREAVAAETDRCADVAARFAGEAAARAGALPAGVGARRHMEAVATAEEVAAAIRAGVTA